MTATRFRAVISGLAALAAAVSAATAATVTGGGVSLTVDESGTVQALQVSGTALSCRAAPFLSLCDVTRGIEFVPGTVTQGQLGGTLHARFDGLAARATLTAEKREHALHFVCDLIGDEELPARGVLLRFALPADCVGWQWHDDMQTTRLIGPGESYENVQALRAWPDLPEWADKPNLRVGAANRNFCTVLTGPLGFCLAPDIERPIIFRTTYDGPMRQLQLVYDLALSPDTATPNRWRFAFDLYACDPAWGFRAALQAYYDMYPHLFKNYIPKPGQWMAFTDLKDIDNANEFHFGLQEGARDPKYDDRIDVQDCTYFTHAGQFIRIPNHDPEKDPAPPFEVILEQTENTFTRNTKLDGVYREVGLHDAAGQFQIPKTRVYGHYIAQFNLDPDLRYGRWHLDRTSQQVEHYASKGGVLDGFYYDGLTTGLNYRTDHFRHSSAPPLWDPAANKPVLNNFFNSCDFARAAAELLRPQGKITMMNGAMHATFYVAPWLDAFGSETGLRIGRSGFNFIRTIIYHKPMLTLLKGNYEQKIGYNEVELFMKRALAYGVFPGFFDWPPSGLGPGGRYWAHPAYYERDRELHRKYLPLVKTLAAAGWEPVTHARSSNAKVFVERYGPDAAGILWLTLLNEEGAPQDTTLAIDAEALGLAATKVRCIDLVNGGEVALRAQDGRLVGDVAVPVDGVFMLQIATPEQGARWRLGQARDAVERGITMRGVDAEYAPSPRAVHWCPYRGAYGRETVGDKHVLALACRDGAEVVASQWAMFFQPEAAPVTLRVRAAGVDLSGTPEVRCRIAWVTSSFSHYEWRNLQLAEGTYDTRDFELEIAAEQPLRAIWVQPRLPAGTKGTLKIASISFEDKFGADYVEDPAFEQWYEPVPESMRARLANDSRGLADALGTACGIVSADVRGPQARDAILRAGADAAALRTWLTAAGAENGCRRALRDLDTAEGHLAAALLAALGVGAPRLEGASRAAPGDEVELTLALRTPRGLEATTAIESEPGVQVRSTRRGAVVTVPADAQPGTAVDVAGAVTIGTDDRRVTVRTTHRIEVTRPLEIAMGTAGSDPGTGAFHVRAEVRNNRTRTVRARLAVAPLAGWTRAPVRTVTLEPGATCAVDLVVAPEPGAGAGAVTVVLTATAGDDVVRTAKRLLYIPPAANLLRNPGFEDGPWNAGEQDTAVAYSGAASLRLHNPTKARSQANQTVVLEQERPCPILVRCASRAQDVSGSRNREYSLYIDIYYMDGTTLYGQTCVFDTGTTGWQVGERIIEPTKPIRSVSVNLLLRGKSGTAWFDDVAVMEDPRRKGSITREAAVTVDSKYGGYSTVPINDGVVHVLEGAHWTEESWASADKEGAHFIELAFEQAHALARVVVYWSLDGGTPKTSRLVHLQVPQGDGWRTLATVTPAGLEEETVFELPAPVSTRRLRLLQPNDKGPHGRSKIMWVREVEVFPTQ